MGPMMAMMFIMLYKKKSNGDISLADRVSGIFASFPTLKIRRCDLYL
jgi:hypothetical protein